MGCTSPRTIHKEYTNQLDSILKAEHVISYDSIALQDDNGEWFYEYFFLKDSLTLRWLDNNKVIKRIDK